MYPIDLDLVLQSARLFPVLPVHGVRDGRCLCGRPACSGNNPGKHPLLANGLHGATRDEATVRQWHALTGGAMNVGHRLGGGVCVLDVDPRHGGDTALDRLLAQHGPLPRTPLVATGGGGSHHYFRCPPGLRTFTVAGDGLQVKGENSYVVAPPSAHASGTAYRWVLAPDGIAAGVGAVPPADLPGWLLAAADAPVFPPAAAPPGPIAGANVLVLPADLTTCPGVGEGRRHDALMRYAGVHFARGEGYEAVLALAVAWAARCSPPFAPAEAAKTVTGIWRTHQRKQWHVPAPVGERSGFLPATTDAPATSFTNGDSGGDSPAADDGPTSFLIDAPDGDEGGEFVMLPMAAPPAPAPAQPTWPALDADAYHGLLGAVVRAVEPQTEADPAGILLCLLTAFGNAAGRGPGFAVGADTHHANLFALLVGDTAAGKGQAQGVADWLMGRADPGWHGGCQCHGLGTGDGLVERLRDAEVGTDEGGHLVAAGGVPDKRLLATESEFFSVLRQLKREGNTLSPMLRNAWDGRPLEVLNRKKNYLKATGHHVSVVGHITPDELAKGIGNTPEVVNGFANRFLFALVRRSRLLPHGGDVGVLEPFVAPLAAALAAARANPRPLRRTAEADRLWEGVYGWLTAGRAGAFGKATERARPQVMRVALVYALADGADAIDEPHLLAALAVWRYCEGSARVLFASPEADESTTHALLSLDDVLLAAIGRDPGVRRGLFYGAAGRRLSAAELDAALDRLAAGGLAHRRTETTRGRSAECWFPGPAVGEETSPAAPPPLLSSPTDAGGPDPEEVVVVSEADASALVRLAHERGGHVRKLDGRLDWSGLSDTEAEPIRRSPAVFDGVVLTYEQFVGELAALADPTPA